MTEYTKGPWVSDEAEGEWAIGDADGRVVAYLHQDDIDLLSEREANARLIAAAPDLLDALKEMVVAVCYNDPPKEMNGVLVHEARIPVEFVQIARAAIARATGADQ